MVALSLQLIEDWQEQHKVIGVECLRSLFARVNVEPDLCVAVFDQSIKCSTYRELPFLQRLYPFLIQLLPLVTSDLKSSILLDTHPVMRLLHLSMDELERSCTADYRRVRFCRTTFCLGQFVLTTG